MEVSIAFQWGMRLKVATKQKRGKFLNSRWAGKSQLSSEKMLGRRTPRAGHSHTKPPVAIQILNFTIENTTKKKKNVL
jgi:hypothetical protein